MHLVHNFISGLMAWYFTILDQFGLLGVVVLMAMESSIFPVPSEMVIPPAAAVHLRDASGGVIIINLLLVILAGTVGSWIGAAATYGVARLLGRPLVLRFGKFLLITEKKLHHADEWIARYGAQGIFLARLLPVVRHVISIPAGIMSMRFSTFSVMTIIGSFIWCTILAIFGFYMQNDMAVLAQHQGHFNNPAEMDAFHKSFNNLTIGTLALVGAAMFCYYLMAKKKRHDVLPSADTPVPEQVK